MPTAESYYDSESNYGNYQYIYVSQVIDSLNFEGQLQDDNFLSTVPRSLLTKFAVDGVRELNFSGQGHTLALELSIGSDLQMILPQDFVDYLRVCVIGEDNKLYTLDYNRNINIANSFLQDHDYELVFDSDGDTIDVDGHNTYAEPYTRYDFAGDFFSGTTSRGSYSTSYSHRKQSNNDTSHFSKFGEFIIDKQRGVIAFSSDLQGKDIVLFYISDGLESNLIDGEKIKIHKYLKTPLEDYIYLRCVERRQNVPQREKYRANQKFKTSKHKAAIRLMDLTPAKISRAMRSVFKPNKF